jgi:hypothetical protein
MSPAFAATIDPLLHRTLVHSVIHFSIAHHSLFTTHHA